ncbi:MAG TPA: uroporphyrinogen-III synthase [Candidatus Angelobacter sp.]|nr:uroporphyrinogen-III synthase [Candidatus Angelobacter sp.]
MTRPVGLGEDTTQTIKKMGWNPLIVHTVELKPREQSEIFTELSRVLTNGPVDWLVLMSPNGAHLLFNILKSHANLLPSALGDLNILAVGPKTREALTKQGILGIQVPNNFSSKGVADFLSANSVEGKRVLLARSFEADKSLAIELSKNGALVETLNLYDSALPSDANSFRRFVDGIEKNQIQAVLFTSSLSASNLFLMSKSEGGLDDLAFRLRKLRVGAIGPVTAHKLIELGIPPTAMPDTFIIDHALKELLC